MFVSFSVAFSFIWVVALVVCCSPVKVVLGVLGVFAVTWNRKDVQVRGCKAMWESELRRNSGFGCVAVRRWRDGRSSHKRSGCRELAYMSYRSCDEMRVTGRLPEVRTRRGTFCGVTTRQTACPRAGSGTGAELLGEAAPRYDEQERRAARMRICDRWFTGCKCGLTL